MNSEKRYLNTLEWYCNLFCKNIPSELACNKEPYGSLRHRRECRMQFNYDACSYRDFQFWHMQFTCSAVWWTTYILCAVLSRVTRKFCFLQILSKFICESTPKTQFLAKNFFLCAGPIFALFDDNILEALFQSSHSTREKWNSFDVETGGNRERRVVFSNWHYKNSH